MIFSSLAKVVAVLAFLSGFLLSPSSAAQVSTLGGTSPDRIIFVDASASNGGDGQTWASAYRLLQDALEEARALAPTETIEIWVADGIYYPHLGGSPTTVLAYNAFEMINNVSIYGGFEGNEVDLAERDWQANKTVLSGDIDGNDTVNAFGLSESFDDLVGRNALHVVRAAQIDNSARLDGFYITGGMADLGGLIDSTFLMRYGAGFYGDNSYPILANLQIQGNRTTLASGRGGGAYFETDSGSSNPPLVMEDVALVNNQSETGGGLYTFRTRLFIDRSEIRGNQASDRGGAVFINLAIQEIRNTVIASNQASDGGGLWSFRGIPALVNVLLSGNYASNNGGGYFIDDPDSLNLTVVWTNTTVSGNRADGIGGGVYRSQPSAGSSVIYNSIFWGNQDTSGIGTSTANMGGPGGANFSAQHSLLQGFNPSGTGNLDGTDSANDPQFNLPVNPALAPTASGNLRVNPDSPIIDRGTLQAQINPFSTFNPPLVPLDGNVLFDLDGQDRVADGDGNGDANVDLGPYESSGINTFTVAGEVVGLNGEGLVLILNDSEALDVETDGAFQFQVPLQSGNFYEVTVGTQPIRPPQICIVNNGDGVIIDNDITTVDVLCTDRADSLFSDRFAD
jgi:hypothetical protein